MKLRFFNRNAVGCHFGGSLYSMVDPHLMLLLMRILGKGFIVWDHSASIRFRKPGQGRVTAHIHITDAQLDDILKKTAGGEKFLPEFKLTVVSAENEAIADISKTLYIRKKKEI